MQEHNEAFASKRAARTEQVATSGFAMNVADASPASGSAGMRTWISIVKPIALLLIVIVCMLAIALPALASGEPFNSAAVSDIQVADTAEPGSEAVDAASDNVARILSAEGETYDVSVSFGPEAGIPSDAELAVKEITSSDESFDGYLAQIDEELGANASSVRLFDISIMSGSQEIQPSADVSVSIVLSDSDNLSDDSLVMHFGDEEKPEIVEASVQDDTVDFDASGFSVYAIVEAPEPAEPEIKTVQDPAELAQAASENTFYLSVPTNRYFKNTLNGNNAFEISSGDVLAANEWGFEPAEGAENAYYVYTVIDGEELYMQNPSANNMALVAKEDCTTIFEVSQATDGTFFFKKQGERKWLQYSGSGRGIRLWNANDNMDNCPITITYSSSVLLPDDPYGLDGQTYGIAYHNDSNTAAAMMAEQKDETHLVAEDMDMKPNVLTNKGILLVAEDSDITEWTFESIREDKYRITTTVDGSTKYLTLSGQALTLTDEPDETASTFRAIPGTDNNAGKYRFASDSGSSIELQLSGSDTSRGFRGTTSTSSASRWLNLVEKSVLDDDDFTVYSAKKVSVSDTEDVYDGQQVVIYTRIWNEEAKRYDPYAVNYDGALIPCYDTGDGIEWIGSKVNTALWRFTEYRNPDGTLNYYYELENTQYDSVIAPQVTGGQVMSDSAFGVNLDGRRFGRNQTTIVAWDDAKYAYAGLKVEDGRVVSCSESDADDFYFAIMNIKEEGDELSEVNTIDGEAYGISMRMFDFNNRIVNNRDSEQMAFMGNETGKGLLSTNLGEDGYPVGTEKAGPDGRGSSFKDLIDNHSDGAVDVNHLFLKSIYNESGYFEYDSTQNFAHLNDDNTFTVYDQLGAITGGEEHKNTREHGQFMPYDNIVEGQYAYDKDGGPILNRTDVLGNELPDSNTRKGEQLYDLGSNTSVDYFFGMEMTASFTQTASGLDAWGHDIIFEFSGDDDFWLYVDGELVLDLGGIHSAQVGSVNFRTGVVTSSNGNSTLYETFWANYRARGVPDDEIEKILNGDPDDPENYPGIFVLNDEGQYVFDDYTNHTMRMFYMERGSGASNLHMRFNLAAVQPGSFLLSKQLSGTDDPSNDLIEFPYQVYYRAEGDDEQTYHLLEEKTYTEGGIRYNVTYKDSTTPVPYKASFTPVGGQTAYSNVFMLRPGDSAQVRLPEDTVDYYVVECGVDPDVYDAVSVNGNLVNGTENDIVTDNMIGGTARHDYRTTVDTWKNRSKVDFDNHVQEGAMRTLSITKRLYDSDGVTPLSYPDDDTLFRFRLYLGNESADPEGLPPANLYAYYVKDQDGHYCRRDSDLQKFDVLEVDGAPVTEYAVLRAYLETLSGAEKDAIVFKTSPNGSISKIPAGYTVEVRSLIAGTQYKVEERDDEIPRGYTLRLEDGYTRVDGGRELKNGTTPYSDTIKAPHVEDPDTDPIIDVRNQIGWGLTVEKVWTDADFMELHDPIYFAVYVRGDSGDTLLDGSVREMKTTEDELYYFFDDLQSGTPFENYLIREVTLEGDDLIVDDEGYVSGYTSVTPIPDDGTGTLEIGGKPVHGTYSEDGFVYSVSYETGAITGHNENIRTDTVTNSRPGIKLYKTDWSGEALADAVFTLKDSDGGDVAAESYTSRGSDGQITIAYLSPGTYTLCETKTPKGYVVLDSPMDITVADDGTIGVAGVDESFYALEQASDDDMASITIKNRESFLEVKKVDSVSGSAIEGVHFALYRQVTDAATGEPRKDYLPMEGYEDLVTNSDGILEDVTAENLKVGTYYLTETQAVSPYKTLEEDLCFTLGDDGRVTIESGGDASWITSRSDEPGSATFVLAIPNAKDKLIRFKKVDNDDPENTALPGAEFDLYRVVDGEREEEPLYSGLVSGDDGLLCADDTTRFHLEEGEYQLVEMSAPEGYLEKSGPVTVYVTAGVDYRDDDPASSSGDSVSVEEEGDINIFTLNIANAVITPDPPEPPTPPTPPTPPEPTPPDPSDDPSGDTPSGDESEEVLPGTGDASSDLLGVLAIAALICGIVCLAAWRRVDGDERKALQNYPGCGPR